VQNNIVHFPRPHRRLVAETPSPLTAPLTCSRAGLPDRHRLPRLDHAAVLRRALGQSVEHEPIYGRVGNAVGLKSLSAIACRIYELQTRAQCYAEENSDS